VIGARHPREMGHALPAPTDSRAALARGRWTASAWLAGDRGRPSGGPKYRRRRRRARFRTSSADRPRALHPRAGRVNQAFEASERRARVCRRADAVDRYRRRPRLTNASRNSRRARDRRRQRAIAEARRTRPKRRGSRRFSRVDARVRSRGGRRPLTPRIPICSSRAAKRRR
jgi:hypothetical protein